MRARVPQLARRLIPAKLLAGVLAVFVLLFVSPAPASAEDPDDVVALIERNDGVYVPFSRNDEFERSAIRAALAQADELGLRAAAIAPLDPWPTNDAFALRVRQAGGYDILISFGPNGKIDSSVDGEVEGDALRARTAARAAASPEAAVSSFLTALVTEPQREAPSLASDVLKWAIILVCSLAASVVLESFFRKRRAIKRAQANSSSRSGLAA